ncbi:MAG: acyltransferase [Lachnospiraceae bacterium]|nr:acyltransferase [Lachnospiraceae bacterium]
MDSESKTLFDRQTGYWFRGIAVIMVILSHYAEWWEWFFSTAGKAEDFRLTLAKLGVYGVNIFFFFSGYGLTKAAEQKNIDGSFILRRIQSVYLPYLVIVGIIQILSGGFASFSAFVKFLYGNDYWFMVILFLFYIGFILIWAVLKNPHIRMLLFLLYTFAIIKVLFDKEMQSFWYVSNLAFAIGIIMGTYEKDCLKIPLPAKILLIPLLLSFVIYYELYLDKAVMTPEQILYLQMLNTVLWTIQIACIAALISWHGRLLGILGKCSLYLYLLHTYIFMRCMNSLNCDIRLRILIAAITTIVTAILCEMLITFLIKLIRSDSKKNRKKKENV